MDMKPIKKEAKQNISCNSSKDFKTSNSLNCHKKSHTKMKPKICRICPEIMFNTSDEFHNHVNERHKGLSTNCFICSICGKQFKTKSELTNHTNSQCGTIKLYKCEVCNQELMTPGSLYNHMLRHKGDPSFMCPFCAKLFLTAGQLKVHERIHTQDKAFVCNVCGKGFCHRQSLITHSTLHTGIKPYLCENCGDSFSCVGNLLKHRKTHPDCGLTPLTTHRVINPFTKMKVKVNTPENSKLKHSQKQKELLESVPKIQSNVNPINRSKVTKITNEPKTFPENYLETTNSSTTMEIEEDSNIDHKYEGEIFQNNIDDSNDLKNLASRLNENISRTTTRDTSNDTNLKKPKCKRDRSRCKITKQELKTFVKERGIQYGQDIKCKYCEKVYCEPRWLLRHEKEFHKLSSICDNSSKLNDLIVENGNTETYRCSCCIESFVDKDDCRNHQINAHVDLLTCQDCDKLFSNPDSLRSHKNTFHKGIPRKTYTYVCERCGKLFRQKSALLHHEQNNCGDGPLIQCHICQKNFSSVHVRKSHMRIHNTEKKLFCKFCGKSFHWKGQMKIHERSHTGEKPFTCLYCPKAFAYRESLITHSSLHTGIKPHLCEACGSRFSCIGNLIKHRVTHASTCGLWYSKNKSEYLQI